MPSLFRALYSSSGYVCRELAPLVVDQRARYLRVAILDSRL